jgi:hypothetical protein
VTFQFDAGVALDQREVIQNGVAFGQMYFGEAGPVSVFASTDLDALAAEADKLYRRSATSESSQDFRRMFSTGQWLASGGSGGIFVWVTDRWKQETPTYKQKSLVHEYFHVVQSWLAKKGPSAAGPIWLSEGAADIAAFGTMARIGAYTLDEVRADRITQTRGMLSPLSSMLTLKDTEVEDTGYPYRVGYLATEYLVSSYGDDRLNVLRKFWEAQGKGASWQNAFKATFGMSVDDFYPKFEEYRRAQFPPYCGSVGTSLAQATPAPFGVRFVRQLMPGAMPRLDAAWTNPPNIPYVFCATGTKLSLLPNSVYKFPTGYGGWIACGANCITIFMRPSTTAGTYTFAITLPSGERAEATFEHSIPSVTATPKP